MSRNPLRPPLRTYDLAELNEAMERARREAAAEAWAAGFMAGLGCRSWPDAHDFAALVGVEYAAGRPLPSTMPRPVLAADEDPAG